MQEMPASNQSAVELRPVSAMWDRSWSFNGAIDNHDVPPSGYISFMHCPEHLREIMLRPDDQSKFFEKAVPDLEPKVTHLDEGCADLKQQL